MPEQFETVKMLLLELGYTIEQEDANNEIVVINDDERGIHNMIIDCEAPILVFEQLVMPLENAPADAYKRILQMNRELVHGAFVLDEDGTRLLFRDTLELNNLDANEIEGTLNALGLALAEFGDELLSIRNNAERR